MAREMNNPGRPPGRFEDSKSYLVKGSTLNTLQRQIREARPLAGAGVLVRQTADGVIIELTRKKALDHPFKVWIADGGVTVTDGTVGSITPVIGSTSLDFVPAPVLTVGAGAVGIYLEITMAASAENRGTVADPEYYIRGGTVTAVAVIAASSPPAGSPATIDRTTGAVTDGTYYRRICTTLDGVPPDTSQPIRFSLEASLCDDGEGEGNISLGVSG